MLKRREKKTFANLAPKVSIQDLHLNLTFVAVG